MLYYRRRNQMLHQACKHLPVLELRMLYAQWDSWHRAVLELTLQRSTNRRRAAHHYMASRSAGLLTR